MISLRQIINELAAEKTRLALTVLAVAWGTFAIATMLATGQGLRVTFGKAMDGVGNGIIYVRGGRTSHVFAGQGMNQRILLSRQDLQLIKEGVPAIKTISPEYHFNTTLRHNKKIFRGRVEAVDPDFAPMRNIIPAPGGRFINALDMQAHKRVVVLGNHMASILFADGRDPLGQWIAIANQPFLVIGVMKKKMQMTGYPDAYLSWIPASTYVALANPRSINTFVLVPEYLQQNLLIKNQIRNLLAFKQHLDPHDHAILKYRDFQIIQQHSQTILIGLQIFLGLVGALTLVVAGVGIANVMFISVNRATREIGIRMAIGARSYQVLIHYVVEALLTTALGGLIGLALAKGVIFGISAIPMHGRFFQTIGKPVPILSPDIALVVVGILGMTGLCAGFFPAYKASRIDPAIALRHD